MNGQLTATRTTFRGWDACALDNGLVRLVAVPDIGGRVMAYDLGPHPFFYVEPALAGKLFTPEENQGDGSLAAWKNYGGDKTWPAPQGWDNDRQWHGPPDPVLDSGRYRLDALRADEQAAVVRMVSPPDARTGVQITRALTLRPHTSRVRLDLAFANVSARPVRWSIWDVVQLNAARRLPDGTTAHDPACVVTVPLNPASRFARGYNVMFGADDNPQWQADAEAGLFRAPYRWQIGKVGLDSPAGWVAFFGGESGFAFVEHFAYEPGADYPDDGATVEVWTVGAGQVGSLDYAGSGINLMETELLSPLRTIPPGASAAFSVEWAACRLPGPVVSVSEAGAAAAPLRAARLDGGYVRLSAQMGVYDQGELRLVWLDAAGNALATWPRGLADPLGAVMIDRVIRPPAGAAAADLRVLAADGAERLLARAALTEG